VSAFTQDQIQDQNHNIPLDKTSTTMDASEDYDMIAALEEAEKRIKEDYDTIAALEVKNGEAEKHIKELHREKRGALDDVDRANTELCEMVEQVRKKDKHITRLHGTIDDLKDALRYERDMSDSKNTKLQRWNDKIKECEREQTATIQAHNELEQRQRETQQQLDEARKQLQRAQSELDEHGALQVELDAAVRAQEELHGDLALLHELDQPDERSLMVREERIERLGRVNARLEQDKAGLKREVANLEHGMAVIAYLNNKLRREVKDLAIPAEELEDHSSGTSTRPPDSLAEELSDLSDHDCYYDDSGSIYDNTPVLELCVTVAAVTAPAAPQLRATAISSTQTDAQQWTAAISTQTDAAEAAEATMTSTACSQTNPIIEVPPTATASVPTQTEVPDKTSPPCAEMKSPEPAVRFCNSKNMVIACLILVALVWHWRDVMGTRSRQHGGYGYGHGQGSVYGRSGAYGNGRYLFGVIPIAMNVGGWEWWISICITCIEKWAGAEPVLLY
jgi:myosin heavy subunit